MQMNDQEMDSIGTYIGKVVSIIPDRIVQIIEDAIDFGTSIRDQGYRQNYQLIETLIVDRLYMQRSRELWWHLKSHPWCVARVRFLQKRYADWPSIVIKNPGTGVTRS